MNVTCEGCGTTYRVDPAKVPAAGVRARCATCDQVFWVRHPQPLPASSVHAASEMHRSVAPALDATSASAAPAAAAFSPLQSPALSTPPDITPVPVPRVEPTEPLAASPPAVTSAPVAPAFARPAFGAATLRTSAAPLPAQELVPPAAQPDATRVAAAAAAEAARLPAPVPTASPVVHAADAGQAAHPPVRAGLATSALGGILPSGGFEAPPRPATVPLAVPKTVGARPPNPFLQQDPAARARRLARALVSDMVTYHPSKKVEGLRDNTLKSLFEDEIRKSWEEYADQVGRESAESTTHFRDALNEILADGRLIF